MVFPIKYSKFIRETYLCKSLTAKNGRLTNHSVLLRIPMHPSFTVQLRAMRIVVGTGILIMLIKFTAYFLTHSNAVLTDAAESVINVVAGSFAYYSIRYAARPKDTTHPYGHGKIEFISAGFEGGLILMAGLTIIIKSVMNLMHPIIVESLDVGAFLAGAAGLINFILGKYLIAVGEKNKSITLVADGKHLLSDTYSSIGLVAGLVVIIFTRIVWLDSLLAIIFGVVIIVTGYRLLRKSFAGLMDEADENVLSDVLKVLNDYRNEQWIDIHNLRVQQYGSSFHIDCHVTLPWYNDLQTSHDELKKMEALIERQFDERVELFIHPDPCIPLSCSICQIADCKVRQKPFERKMEWTLENVLKNERHQL
jgi:cation diffusion facilitator family transporter